MAWCMYSSSPHTHAPSRPPHYLSHLAPSLSTHPTLPSPLTLPSLPFPPRSLTLHSPTLPPRSPHSPLTLRCPHSPHSPLPHAPSPNSPLPHAPSLPYSPLLALSVSHPACSAPRSRLLPTPPLGDGCCRRRGGGEAGSGCCRRQPPRRSTPVNRRPRQCTHPPTHTHSRYPVIQLVVRRRSTYVIIRS